MNGTWYPWCQSPTLYKEKFRLLAQYIHTNTKNTAMLWTPNSGGGYPFLGGPYGIQPGTPEYSVLDTDGNNKLDMNDDMYTPYYPGDDTVDWVGMSVYHWGQTYPWIENELPEARNFTDQITGNYNGLNGNQLAVPDFYSMFCNEGVPIKPMAIPETAAFYNTEQGGTSELAIKQAWWHQVFNYSGDTNDALDISVHFPKIKMINWFAFRNFNQINLEAVSTVPQGFRHFSLNLIQGFVWGNGLYGNFFPKTKSIETSNFMFILNCI